MLLSALFTLIVLPSTQAGPLPGIALPCFFWGCNTAVIAPEPSNSPTPQSSLGSPTLEPLSCPSLLTCEDCLGSGCALVFGGCYDSCDAAPGGFGIICNLASSSTSVSEDCEAIEQRQADKTICEQQTSCDECMDTIISDGESTCGWYTQNGSGGECCSGRICDFRASREPSCPIVCEELSTCEECLGSGCALVSGNCYGSCAKAPSGFDFHCITASSQGSASEACEDIEDHRADELLCGQQTDCGECLGAVLSDGVSTCGWYTRGSSGECCSPGICDGDFWATRETSCPCRDVSGCEDCLSNGCAIAFGFCFNSCDDAPSGQGIPCNTAASPQDVLEVCNRLE